MISLQEHIDALDKMVVNHASVPEIRSQIAFIGREVAALEARYAQLAVKHQNSLVRTKQLEASQQKPSFQPPPQSSDEVLPGADC
jgi:hypothetical protein